MFKCFSCKKIKSREDFGDRNFRCEKRRKNRCKECEEKLLPWKKKAPLPDTTPEMRKEKKSAQLKFLKSKIK